MNYLQPKSVYNRIGWFFCVMEVVIVFVEVLADILIAALDSRLVNQINVQMGMTILSYYCIAFPVFAVCMNTLEGRAKEEKSKFGFLEMTKFFFLSFAVMNVANFINILVYSGFQLVTGHEVKSALDSVLTEPTPLVMLTTVILAPIVEEYTFRYFTLNKLRKYGDKTAIIVTSVLFGLSHMNFEQFFYAAAIGLVFGYVVCKTGRVWYSIILHMLLNFFNGALPLMMQQMDNPFVEMGYTIFYYAAILIGILLFCFNVSKIRLEQGKEPVYNPVGTAMSSPGMLVYGIVSVVIMMVTLAGQFITALIS